MPAVRDLLDRFRPAGAPGAATAVGVPADRREAVAAELEPVFAALAIAVVEAQQTRLDAEHAGAALVADADRRAAALVARAKTEAESERAAEAARAQTRVADEAALMVARATNQSELIHRRGGEVRTELVGNVVALVWAELRRIADEHEIGSDP